MTNSPEIPPEWHERLQAVVGKRARIVIDHILQHGFITTEELEKQYGYSHPPRAARDVREQGIPLETFKAKAVDGRIIAAYRFGQLPQTASVLSRGRRNFPKWFKQSLFAEQKGHCAICSGEFGSRYLQIDHCIPYAIGGDRDKFTLDIADFMLVCGSCNRAKSWSCEHCANWMVKSATVCQTCYWANPKQYTHVALQEVRRLDLIWQSHEIELYERLKEMAHQIDSPLPEYVKAILRQVLNVDESDKTA